MTLIYQTKFLARERRLLRVGADCDRARTLRSAQAGSALDALRRLAGGNHSTFFYILFQSSSSATHRVRVSPCRVHARGRLGTRHSNRHRARHAFAALSDGGQSRRGRRKRCSRCSIEKKIESGARRSKSKSRSGSSWATGRCSRPHRSIGSASRGRHGAHRSPLPPTAFNPLPEPGLRVRRCVGQPHPRRVAFRRRHKPDPRSTISRARSGFSVALSEGRRPSAV